MKGPAPRGFWITNHLANPVLLPLLRSTAGRRLGRHLAVVRYRGRRTGQARELVVQYAREGDHVWVVPGRPDRKTWWRNFLAPSAVEVRLAGHDFHGHAVALDGREHATEVQGGLARYLHELPRTRKALGIPADRGTDAATDLAGAAERVVMVRIDLDTS